jgi:hypothetical protein
MIVRNCENASPVASLPSDQSLRFRLGLGFLAVMLLGGRLPAADSPNTTPAGTPVALTPLILKLPSPAEKGTPKDIPLGSNVEPLSTNARPPMLVPAGLTNLAPGATVTCSDRNAGPDMLAKLADGEKEPADQNIVSLRKGLQWVQLDFGSPKDLFAVVIWHAYKADLIYHDVIVRVADDPDFMQNVRTLFNNDQANTAGLGAGADREYFESNEGKLINTKGARARCIRFYSKGSTDGALNEYTEIEVYGRAALSP